MAGIGGTSIGDDEGGTDIGDDEGGERRCPYI
jgi:hypothetical protein